MNAETHPAPGNPVRSILVTSLTTLFGLQMVRLLFPLFVGYLRDSQGMAALTLGPIAIGLFALSFLAGPLWRILGARRSLWVTAGGLTLARLLEQLSTSPPIDLLLTAAGGVLFLLYLPVGIGLSRARGRAGGAQFGAAILLGMALDTAIQVGNITLDLSWQPGVIPVLIVLGIGIALVFALRVEVANLESATPLDGTWRANLPLIALGPWLFLQLLAFQNVARVAALTGLDMPLAGAWVVIGNTLALTLAVWLGRGDLRPLTISLVAGVLLQGAISDPEPAGLLAGLLVFIGLVASAVLIQVVFSGTGTEPGRPGLARTTVAHGIGQLFLVLLVFLYYLTFDVSIGIRPQIILPVAALLVVIGALFAGRSHPGAIQIDLGYALAGVAGVLIVIPVIRLLIWETHTPIQPDPANRAVRVMSYNLHNGFNTAGRLDLEALARVIEDSGADVIALQEISRGWLVWGGDDMLAWLSQRLDMPYVSGPTADAQWGNAIFSRYPMGNVRLVPLPPDDLLILRGYIQVDIQVGAGDLTLIDTHFYHPDEGSEVRVLQSAALLAALEREDAIVLAGDLNATPDSPEMRMLADAGLVDLAAVLGDPPTYTYSSASPEKQIDYLWTTPDLVASDFAIIQTTASDHLPLVATISLP